MEFIQKIDDTILYYIYENWHNGFTDTFFTVISKLADCGFIWILAAAVMLFIKKWRPAGIVLLLSLGISAVIGSLAVKNIVCRLRPFNADEALMLLIPHPGGYYSFPSGHSTAAGAGAALIFMRNKAVGAIAIAYGLLLGFSRVFLVVHYPTDVLCGFILGAVCSIVLWKLTYSKIDSRLDLLYEKRAEKKKAA